MIIVNNRGIANHLEINSIIQDTDNDYFLVCYDSQVHPNRRYFLLDLKNGRVAHESNKPSLNDLFNSYKHEIKNVFSPKEAQLVLGGGR